MPLKFFSRNIRKKFCLPVFFILSGLLLYVQTLSANSQTTGEIVLLSSPPGVYSENLNLRIASLVKNADIYYSFLMEKKKYSPYIPYTGPIKLSAVAGEVRDYQLQVILKRENKIVGAREYRYVIDKEPPLPPDILINGKKYPSSNFEVNYRATLTFDHTKTEKNIKVYYSINGNVWDNAKLWRGNPIILEGVKGKKRIYTVMWFGEDRAGNKSVVRAITFSINRETPSLKVVSPVEGNYANYQYLTILYKNLQWVKYTLDGSDPVERGKLYTGPFLIRKTGHLIINIVGKLYNSENYLKRRIEVVVRPEKKATLYCDTESGIYRNGLKVAVSSHERAIVYYTLSENTPSQYDFVAAKYISLPSIPGAEKFYVLRLRSRSDNEIWGKEYRYFYIIDRKKPERPEININRYTDKDGRLTKKYLVRISSLGEVSHIYYSFDSNPTPNGMEFKEPFAINPEELTGKKKGSLTIRAIAVDRAGNISESSSKTLKFDFTVPKIPRIKYVYLKKQGVFYLEVGNLKANSDNSIKLLYEISSEGKVPRPLTIFSPYVINRLKITLPYGMDRTFKLRFGISGGNGLITPIGGIKEVRIDRMPPKQPTILVSGLYDGVSSKSNSSKVFDEDLKLTVIGEGNIYYELTSDGTIPDDPTFHSPRLEMKNQRGVISLKGKAGEKLKYYLKLLCVDSSGNVSGVYGPFGYVIDKRVPRVPTIKDYKAGKHYGVSPLIFRLPKHFSVLHYTFSDNGEEPPDPTLESPIAGEKLVFNGEAGKEKNFRVKILPFSPMGHIKGQLRELHFTIDLKPPEVPPLIGFKDGGIYRRALYLKLDRKAVSLGQHIKVFLSYSKGDDVPPDPIKFGKIVKDSYLLDISPGEEALFKIRLSALDEAGNRALYDRFYTVTIDKRPPEPVIVRGLPEHGITNSAVAITLVSSESDGEIFYTITSDGSRPPIPGRGALRYSSPIILSGEEGKVVTYRIFPRAVDRAGNFTESYRIYSVIIDREKPLLPPSPVMSYSSIDHTKIAVVSWTNYDDEIFYRLDGGKYRKYTHPFAVKKTTSLEYFGMDLAGNKSAVTRVSIRINNRVLRPPRIIGVKNGGLYNKGVTLSLSAPMGSVHYEISLNGREPLDVTRDSPVFGKSMKIDALDGETIRVILKTRAIDLYGNRSKISRVEFTIDKTPPKAPIIVGVERGMRYQNSKEISLVSDEGTIYYTVSNNGEDPTIPPPLPKYRYRKNILLKAVDGKIVDYRILAYTVDKAGNRSRDIPLWRVILDRKIIYVATNGNDLYDGTSSKPLKTIEKAIAVARELKRKTIYIGYGEYKINHTLSCDIKGLTLVGGYNPSNWKKSTFYETKIVGGKYLENDAPLVKVTGTDLTLKNITLSGANVGGRYIVELGGGKLGIKNCKILLAEGKTKWAFLQYGGLLRVVGTKFTGDVNIPLSASGYILSTGGRLEILGSDFEGVNVSGDFCVIKVVENEMTLLRGITIDPVISKLTTAVSIEGSKLEISNSTIDSGIARKQSIALRIRNSDAKIIGNKIKLNAKSAYSLGISLEGGKSQITNNTFYIRARYGAAGAQIKGGQTLFEKNRLYGLSSSEYLYLLDIEGQGRYFNNILYGGISSDSITVQILNSNPDLFNNTIIGGQGTDTAIGLMIRGRSMPRVINNIVVSNNTSRAGRRVGILISGDRPTFKFPIIANDISGWTSLVRIESLSATRSLYKYQSSIVQKKFKDIESFNLYDKDPFGGNIDKNISESISKTFVGLKKNNLILRKLSKCVNGGINLNNDRYRGPVDDIRGQKRPAPLVGIKPTYDIGAYELY